MSDESHSERSDGGPRGLFAIDLRGLAAMRIGAGVILLFDLAYRAADYAAHYGDHGVLPRELFADEYLTDWRVSLHAYLGPTGQLVLWITQVVAAVMLMTGYRTRLATVISWLLLASLHSRNYMVMQAGDTALRLILFWGMFLPLGARWSIDAAIRGEAAPVRRIRTLATLALVAQLALIYGVATMSKLSQPLWWKEGLGVYYALSTEEFTTSLGLWLRDQTGLTVALNYATIAVQGAVPILLLTPWRNHEARTAGAAVLIPMHVAFMLCLSIGLFSYILCVFWLAMLPSRVWDGAERTWTLTGARLGLGPPRIRGWPGSWIEAARTRRRRRPHPVERVCASELARGFVAAAVVYGLWWNVSVNPVFAMEGAARVPGRVLRLEQRWHMFANPPRAAGWFVAVGRTQTGSRIDPLSGDAPSFEEPELLSSVYAGQRWRKYMINIERDQYRRHRKLYLDWLCRQWNEAHSDRELVWISLYRVERKTPPPGQPAEPVKRKLLERGQCR